MEPVTLEPGTSSGVGNTGSCGGCSDSRPCAKCGMPTESRDHQRLLWAEAIANRPGQSLFWRTALAAEAFFTPDADGWAPDETSGVGRAVRLHQRTVAAQSGGSMAWGVPTAFAVQGDGNGGPILVGDEPPTQPQPGPPEPGGVNLVPKLDEPTGGPPHQCCCPKDIQIIPAGGPPGGLGDRFTDPKFLWHPFKNGLPLPQQHAFTVVVTADWPRYREYEPCAIVWLEDTDFPYRRDPNAPPGVRRRDPRQPANQWVDMFGTFYANATDSSDIFGAWKGAMSVGPDAAVAAGDSTRVGPSTTETRITDGPGLDRSDTDFVRHLSGVVRVMPGCVYCKPIEKKWMQIIGFKPKPGAPGAITPIKNIFWAEGDTTAPPDAASLKEVQAWPGWQTVPPVR